VEGISHLVASSIEGLKPNRVTILDSYGNVLRSGILGDEESVVGLTNSQLSLKRDVETYLSWKAQSMLESVVGLGNAVVKVDATLNFRNIVQTVESYDPEGQVVRSEQRGGGQAGVEEVGSITNYEISKTIERVVGEMGNLNRLSAAAIINGTYTWEEDEEGNMIGQYAPRTPDEMEKLTAIVKSSLGIDSERGDHLEVVNVAFGQPSFDSVPQMSVNLFPTRMVPMAAVVLIAVLGLMMLMRRRPKAVSEPVRMEAGEAYREGEEVVTVATEDERKKELVQFARDHPDQMASLLRTWLKAS
jgi:flagellar M-ring protein FliF